MARRAKRKRRVTGVALEEAVIAYLDRLADEEERDRSYFINRIVREHAERNGDAIPLTDVEKTEASNA